MLPVPRLPRNMMLAISLAQGLALLLLWRALTHETWPSQTPLVNFPLWTLVIAWPVLLLLSLEAGNTARAFTLTGAFSGLLVLLAVYTGWQASPFGEFPIIFLMFGYIVTLIIACFKALMYLQQRAGGLPMTYEVLFALSWRNFLVTGLAVAFMGGVSGLLALWAALFRVIDIDFFSELFSKDWFLFPVLAVAFGIGVFIFRRLTGVIDGITGLLEGLMRLLLPLVIAIMVIFLAALPFTGLEPLWETGAGTALLLCLGVVVLFFINAVYQTGQHSPYPEIVHRLLYPGIALLPVIPVLALYGLYLRVDQYGWTVSRCWALAITVLLGMFAGGYLWEIIRRLSAWPQGLARVNIVMGLVVLALMLLVNSPLLNFRSISLASQLERVATGELELSEFDFDYVNQYLARPGFLELQALIGQLQVSDPALAGRILRAMDSVRRESDETSVDFWERITFRPQRFDVPPELQTLVENSVIRPLHEPATSSRDGANGLQDDEPPAEDGLAEFGPASVLYRNPVFIRADLNHDGLSEYVLLGVAPESRWVFGLCFYLADGAWQHRKVTLVSPSLTGSAEGEALDVSDALHQGEITVVAPAFRDLQVGELVLRVR